MSNKDFNALDKLFERAEKVLGKKLTTKDRKKLKESTFCGPNRSFPVPDCKHVATAKAYLGRSKFSQDTKKKIAACINRKAKALGCNVSKKAKADELPNAPEMDVMLLEDPIFASTKELVEKSIDNPGLHLEWDNRTKDKTCKECYDHVEEEVDEEREESLPTEDEAV
jgi:hypothetical protein